MSGGLDSLTLLMRDLRRGPRLLTRDEERALFKRYQAGDVEAKQHLIEANVRLCVSIAKRYRGRGLDLGDLVGHGLEGLVLAIELFDLDRGTRLSTYATLHIRAAVQRAVANTARTVRLPAHVERQRYKLDKAEQRLLAATGKASDTDVITAAGVDLTPEDLSLVRRAARPPASLEVPTGEDGDGAPLLNFQTNENVLAGANPPADPAYDALANVEVQALREALDQVSYRQRRVIVMRHGLFGEREHTLDEVAKAFGGLQREQIRQIQLRAERNLAELPEAAALAA